MPKFLNFSNQIFSKAVLFFVFGLIVCSIAAAEVGKSTLDTSRYIGIDEVKPGMQAYCLTVFSGTEIEKFELEIVSVIRNFEPNRNAILVKGVDERFMHAGVVAGCSGSPVYIDGRMAGALAFGWTFSKDPLYGVTPIEEMLEVGTGSVGSHSGRMQMSLDLSGPIDLPRIEKQFIASLSQGQAESSMKLLPAPIIISGLGESVAQFDELLAPLGLMTVAGLGGGTVDGDEQAEMVPGACLVVPLVDGDIKLAAVGTATEVVGGQVFGFGHDVLGYGSVDYPMAVGKVHTVVANTQRSFKLGSSIKTIGSLNFDESTAVRGTIGKAADTIPMTIEISRFNDTKTRKYECTIVNNERLTPLLFRTSLGGAVLQRGALPLDHTLRYQMTVLFDGGGELSFENISSNNGISELLTETMTPLALLLNNPFKPVKVKSIRCAVDESDKVLLGEIRSIGLSDTTVEPGGQFSVDVFVESRRSPEKKYTFDLTVPEDLKPGEYDVLIAGGYGYYDFLTKAATYRFLAEDVDSLIEALNEILRIRRDRLYCMFVLPESGISLEKAKLPDFPLTKTLVLADSTRTLPVRPYYHWLEQSSRTSAVILGAEEVKIEVISK